MLRIRNISYFLFCLLLSKNLFAQNDTLKFNIYHNEIHLRITDFTGKTISGNTLIHIKANTITNHIYLMLKALTIDSILSNNQKVTYTFKDPNIDIKLNNLLNSGDSIILNAYYHGQPVTDSTWGGFYFTSDFAFNMGVAFTDNPNPFGRVWFPCLDNFTDKATYSLWITTTRDKKAMCGGILIDTNLNTDSTITWHWNLNQPAPSYLVSVAVANYANVKFIHKGITKNFPVILACLAVDTSNMKISFSNINNALNIFEKLYTPYAFDRAGFTGVPFNGGAMEHIGNISYPYFAIDGTLNYEALWVHELSHHWWGDKVTCQSSAEMWLNEGWASYSVYLFDEKQYGKTSYQDGVRSNHKLDLQYSHIADGSPIAIAPVSHANTYGTTVYKKGADMIHTLRGYLGDSLFFLGIKNYLIAKQFGNSSSADFRDSMIKYTGYDLNDFFNNWVFTPGFPHFYIYRSSSTPAGNNYSVNLIINQSLRFTNNLFHHVPLKIAFYNSDWTRQDKYIIMDSLSQSFQYTLSFQPSLIIIDPDAQISDARTSYSMTIKSSGTYDFQEALMTLDVSSVQDSALVYIQHHWIGSGSENLPDIRLSDYRYWTVDGIFPTNFSANATILYNGTEGTNYDGTNYLDYTLNIVDEDSLVILYRKSPEFPWQLYNNFQLTTGIKTDKKGSLKILNLTKGDYCLGIYDKTASINKINMADEIKIYPNPTNTVLNIEVPQNFNPEMIYLIDTSGKIAKTLKVKQEHIFSISVSGLKTGNYILKLMGNGKIINKPVSLIH